MPGPLTVVNLQAAPGGWRVSTAPATGALATVVKEYWEVEGSLDAFRETILPNGFVEMMVNLGPSHRILSGPAAGVWEHSWYSGLQERSLAIESLGGTHLVSVRLHPLGARELLGAPVAAVVNTVVHLDTLLGDDAESLRRRLLALGDPAHRFVALEEFLIGRLGRRDPVPDLVWNAAARIEAAHGDIRIGDIHPALGVSRKHLVALFTRYLGLPPKAYARILRFAWTLDRLRTSESVDWSVLAHAAGYSDQSHLVREFRRAGAATPSTYLRRRSPDGTALLYQAGEVIDSPEAARAPEARL